MAICQECGRPATYVQKNAAKYKGVKKRRHTRARADHDLCRRCWRKTLDAIEAAERNHWDGTTKTPTTSSTNPSGPF